MKSFKAGTGLSQWIMRVGICGLLLFNNFPEVLDLNLEALTFYLSLLKVIFSVMLFVGGFLTKPSITVISGLVLTILTTLDIFESWPGTINSYVFIQIIIVSLCFFFLTHGNRG